MNKLPWEVVFEDKWPFDIVINSQEERIGRFQRKCFSSSQNSVEDVRNAIGFRSEEQDTIKKIVKRQEENILLIVEAVNAYNNHRQSIDVALNYLKNNQSVLAQKVLTDALNTSYLHMYKN